MRKFLLLWCIAFILVGASKTNSQAIPKVDFCALFDSYDKYEGKTISSTALMTWSTVTRVDGGDSVLYSLKCNDNDHFATLYTKQFANFLENLKDESHFIFEIKFVGKITVKETLSFGHLGLARAEINIKKFTSSKALATDLKSYWPDFEAAAPVVKRAEKLGVDGKIFLQSLYIQPKRMVDDVSSVLSDDFVFKKKDGRTLSKDEYLKSDSPVIVSLKDVLWTEIGMRRIERTKQGIGALGIIKIGVNTSTEKTFRCLMSFTLKDGFWIITSAQLK